MAKLYSYYTLCPLIDQQNLLGVERDSECGCAIVTLGRNIVIRYKLQDLKQLSSWSSKDRLTTQVIYDETTRQYAAIFNEKKIRLWSAEETDLNNVKGYKFQSALHTILTHETHPPVLVRKDGATASLEWAIKNRKSWSKKGILNADEKILDCHLICNAGKISLCLLTETKGTYNSVLVKLNNETYSEEMDRINKMELKQNSEELVGHAVLQTKTRACLLTLWSNGKLHSYPLTETNESSSSTLIGIINNINTKHPVVMTPLNETTIAAYGADASEEGAVLMIYNVQFKLVQDVQKLKLYTTDAKLWKIEDKLLLAANRHLAIAPFHLAPQRIATLLGSSLRFKASDENADDDEIVVIQESTVAHWEKGGSNPIKQPIQKPPVKLSKQISSYMNEGLSDAAIQEMLIPQLIESKDVEGILWCLNNFKDLPEKLLADLLIFCLRSPEETFVPVQNGTTDDFPANKMLYSRNDFLDKIFSLTYSDISLSSYLKIGLKFDEVLQLLQYLIQKLDDQEDFLDNIVQQPTDKQLYEWSSLLLESHYHQYILSGDPEVSILLNKLGYVLDDHLQLFKDMENLRPILKRTINGKSSKLLQKNRNKFYAIEEIKLY
ncbi:nucleolar protein 11 isoform X1 [Osmia lignaria lignaria]|uniref:nucleolar protein 11 isoform X1 n=1 Tax=Osmia lignaria lignaria TaxID=1437193 RepID=UPI00402B6BFB